MHEHFFTQIPRCCYFCTRTDTLERHHIFGGSRRKASEQYGFTVYLCHWCHNEPGGVHFDREKSDHLKRRAQEQFELYYGDRDEFRKVFGKSYL
jgi:hypothetical protein